MTERNTSKHTSENATGRAVPAPRFAALGLAAADMAASLAFYRRLGLDIPAEADTAPHAEAQLPGGLRLMWDSHETLRALDPDWELSTGNTPHLAFECPGPEAVDALYAELVDAGYRGGKKPWDAVWGQRYAVVLDPDGHGVDLFAPLP
ncbi:VOC family protein [Streptomyces sclerotialus]|uniref:VOC family protein n=1 Tax=Streptomyces sclerotialus TaxID=1957 RepID=UPI000B2479C2